MSGAGTWGVGGTFWTVDGLSVKDAASSPPTLECLRAERAVALAAWECRVADPMAALEFTRRALSYTTEQFAAALDMALVTIELCEAGRWLVAPEMVGRIIDLLTESDRGGYVARRVYP